MNQSFSFWVQVEPKVFLNRWHRFVLEAIDRTCVHLVVANFVGSVVLAAVGFVGAIVAVVHPSLVQILLRHCCHQG